MLRRSFVARMMQSGQGGIGAAHPDIYQHMTTTRYKGPGWMNSFKTLPEDMFAAHPGVSTKSHNDRMGQLHDPEDPRHPMVATNRTMDTRYDVLVASRANGHIHGVAKSSRLLQLLYDSYLEPFNMGRVAVGVGTPTVEPNYGSTPLFSTVTYCGQTAQLIGRVHVGIDAVIMEGVTARADTNDIYIFDGAQVLENCMIVADSPTDLFEYTRFGETNPYQTIAHTEGIVRIGNNSIVEPNCYIDSSVLGPFNRIGHGTKIMRGCTAGSMVHVLPGSVVSPGTAMGDGELWGGAPAEKIGKVSKYEYKRPYFASMVHKEQVLEAYAAISAYGDQTTHWYTATRELETLMIEAESHLPESVQVRLREFAEGREPFQHMFARVNQQWRPSVMPSEVEIITALPMPSIQPFAEHNGAFEKGELHGTYRSVTNMFSDYRW